MEQIVSFEFNTIEIILVAALIVLSLIQVFYYRIFYNKPLVYEKNKIYNTKNGSNTSKENTPSVSVIIVTQNRSEDLSLNLPMILEQDYPNYEVIVINNGSTEETDRSISELKLRYPHLYTTFLPFEALERNADRRKLALTIGIKAAKNDILLFTEADTTPLSNGWIASMMENMTEDKDVVLGYCYAKKSNKHYHHFVRFDNLFYSLKYLSLALIGKPFTGTYRNVAYRKQLFFENKGFSDFLNYEHSEGMFLNKIFSPENVAISIARESFVQTDIQSLKRWEDIREAYFRTKRHFKNNKHINSLFLMETGSRYLFYILLILSIGYSIINANWSLLVIVNLIFLIKKATQLITLNKVAKHFKSGEFYLSFVALEIAQPICNLYYRILSRKRRSDI